MIKNSDDYQKQRKRMVEEQIVRRGVRNPLVLDAMRIVPRHEFVPEDKQELAYWDGPLSIGEGQTISQPYIVAWMTELLELKPEDKVLEIGTGSGYQVAVLSRIVEKVYTIEYLKNLQEKAKKVLKKLKYKNIRYRVGDGRKGWPKEAPFDAIMVTAAASDVPKKLIEQLAEGGRMLIPIGNLMWQKMVRLRKIKGKTIREDLDPVAFVPLVGDGK